MAFQGRHDDGDTPDTNDTPEGGSAPHRARDGSRDERGRFVGSGNPKGRPRKLKLPPANSLPAAIALGLQKEMVIRIDGKQQAVPAFEALAAKIIHAMMTGSYKDILTGFRHLEKLGVFDVMTAVQDYKDSLEDENSAPPWTPELEAKYRAIFDESGDYVGFGTDGEGEVAPGDKADGQGGDEGHLNSGWDGPRT